MTEFIQQVSFSEDADKNFRDAPLDRVSQDNISVDIYIGPIDAFSRRNGVLTPTNIGTEREQARPYDTFNLEIELTDNSDSNLVTGMLTPRGDHNLKPVVVDPLSRGGLTGEMITVDVDNELIRETDTQEITRLFTGVISNSSRLGDHGFEIIAFWPGFNELQNGTIFTSPSPPEESSTAVRYSNTRDPVSELAERIVEQVVEDPFEATINVDPSGIKVGEKPNGFPVIAGFDTEVRVGGSARVDITDEKSEGLLTRIIEASQSIWEVDRYGDFYFGAPRPDVHTVRYITDMSAGKSSPAWQSVRVIGDGIASEQGWDKSALINKNPKEVADNVSVGIKDEELSEPTFVYRNMEIDTQEELERVEQNLIDEILKQKGNGYVETVGHPEVWPGDGIQLPDSRRQPFAAERFYVKNVIHRLNASDGFLTRIECGGLTNGTETVFEDEIQERAKEYERDQQLEGTGLRR